EDGTRSSLNCPAGTDGPSPRLRQRGATPSPPWALRVAPGDWGSRRTAAAHAPIDAERSALEGQIQARVPRASQLPAALVRRAPLRRVRQPLIGSPRPDSKAEHALIHNPTPDLLIQCAAELQTTMRRVQAR